MGQFFFVLVREGRMLLELLTTACGTLVITAWVSHSSTYGNSDISNTHEEGHEMLVIHTRYDRYLLRISCAEDMEDVKNHVTLLVRDVCQDQDTAGDLL